MSRTCCESFRKWFEYEKDAHAKVLRSLESVPADRRAAPEFQRAKSIMGHIAFARRAWLSRIQKAPFPSDPRFPEDVDLEKLREEFRAVHQVWTRYLTTLDDAELARVLEFDSPIVGHMRQPIQEILPHLFTHSAYHRGQIAALVRAAGGEPASTDYILWCRDSQSPA
jgi:uncharacterized damage-inducible protein DinB